MKILTLLCTTLFLCSAATVATFAAEEAPNYISDAEKAEGWTLLFDGQTMKGWHSWKTRKQVEHGGSWVIKDDAITLNKKGGGDLYTAKSYKNFDFTIDYKTKGNSGLFIRVDPKSEGKIWHSAPEVQVERDKGTKTAGTPSASASKTTRPPIGSTAKKCTRTPSVATTGTPAWRKVNSVNIKASPSWPTAISACRTTARRCSSATSRSANCNAQTRTPRAPATRTSPLMNPRAVIHIISHVVFSLSTGMFVACGVSHLMDDPEEATRGILYSALITGACASIMWLSTRSWKGVLQRRDSYAIVTFGWLCGMIFCTLPYLLTGAIPNVASAFFESTSGITATGATVLTDIESHSSGLLFFRATTQWLGGMGVLVLVIAVVPFLGGGAMALYQAEIPGVTAERLTPRIAGTARVLWYMYLGLTLLCTICLKICGMSWFDSICHAFCTIATGGFSTHTQSIAYFDSIAIELVVMVFMLLSGINFALHFRSLKKGPMVYLRDEETRVFCLLLAGCILVMTFGLWRANNEFATIGQALRAASFECIAVVTTTGFGGYGTQSFPNWGVLAVTMVAVISFFGACSGSTSGGMKIARLAVGVKVVLRELKLMVITKGIYRVKMNTKVVPESTISRTIAFLVAFVVIAAFSVAVMSFFCPDEVSAISSVCATITNVGPGVGNHVGPQGSFAMIESPGKVYLSFLMLLGRLELFTLLVIFTPLFWRK